MAAPDVPFQTGMVLVLLGILMVMGLSGILVSDLVRNMWQYSEGSSDLSGRLYQSRSRFDPEQVSYGTIFCPLIFVRSTIGQKME